MLPEKMLDLETKICKGVPEISRGMLYFSNPAADYPPLLQFRPRTTS